MSQQTETLLFDLPLHGALFSECGWLVGWWAVCTHDRQTDGRTGAHTHTHTKLYPLLITYPLTTPLSR